MVGDVLDADISDAVVQVLGHLLVDDRRRVAGVVDAERVAELGRLLVLHLGAVGVHPELVGARVELDSHGLRGGTDVQLNHVRYGRTVEERHLVVPPQEMGLLSRLVLDGETEEAAVASRYRRGRGAGGQGECDQ